jgi:hypothetical protein
LQAGELALEFIGQAGQGKACENRSLGIVLMSLRIAKVGQQSVSEVQSYVATEALDDCARAVMIVRQDFAPVFRIERGGDRRRIDQIAEEDRQTAPFSLIDP